ncbi:MAG: hypothetical protein ACTSUE_06055 [Promethearchaeota archaeon]
MGKKFKLFCETDGEIGSAILEIDNSDTFADVKKKVMDAFGKTDADTLGKVFLQQQIEIRDLDSVHYKSKRLLEISTFSDKDKIEVHFKNVPILFLLFTNDKKTLRKVLHVNPSENIRKVEDMVTETFGLRDDIELDFVHQSYLMTDTKKLSEFENFDPAHSIVVIPRIFRDEPERVPLT